MSDYSLDKFEKDFIDIDFDKILKITNNVFVNSNKYYLEFKQKYFEKTLQNKNAFLDLLSIYNNLNVNNKIIENSDNDEHINKYTFTYIDSKELADINNSIKNLLKIQKEIYTNFVNYIIFINPQGLST